MGTLRYEDDEDSNNDAWSTSHRDVWWEEISDGWVIALRLVPNEGYAGAPEVRFFPDDGDPERKAGEWRHHGSKPPKETVPSSLLRKAKLTTMLRAARVALARDGDAIDRTAFDSADPEWRDLSLLGSDLIDAGFDPSVVAEPTPSERRPGRRGANLFDILGRIVVPYVKACRDPDRARKAIQQVATLSEESPAYVAQIIYQARHKWDLLTAAPAPGQPGGELTEKAISILKDANTEPTNE